MSYRLLGVGFRIALCVLLALRCLAAPGDETTASTTIRPHKIVPVDDSVWVFNNAAFDQDKVLSFGDYQYTIYWDADAALSIARRNHRTDDVQVQHFPQHVLSPRQNDGHRNTVIGVSHGDGRLHFSFDHHCNDLRYARSRAGFLTSPPATMTAADFESTQPLAPGAPQRVTYPRFFNDNDGGLFLLYRSGGSGRGDTVLARYDATRTAWDIVATRLIGMSGTYAPWNGNRTRSAYEHTVLFDRAGRLHLTWLFRETSRTWASNHDLYYLASDNRGLTWMNNEGTVVADTAGSQTVTLDTPGIRVVDIPVYSWLMNSGTMVIDSRNQPHIITYRFSETYKPNRLEHDPPGGARARQCFYHYWRTPDGVWHGMPVVPPENERGAIRRPEAVVDAEDTIYFYWSSPNGFRCHAARAQDDWGRWVTFLMSGPELRSHDACIHDRALLKGKGTLCFTANHLGGKARGFAIVEYRLADLARAASLMSGQAARDASAPR